MKRLVYLLYAAVILAVLAVASVAAFALLFDPNKFKPEIEQLVMRSTQRTLKLEGELGIAFYPSLGVSLGRTTLSERNGPKAFAAIDSAHVSIAVLPLLRGEMVADEVRLAGLRASVVRSKDGGTNIDDLLGGAAPAAQAQPAPQKDAKALRFDISGTRIERANLSYRDEGTGQALEIEGLDLRTGRIADDVPGALRFSALLKGKNPALDLRLELSGEYRLNFGERLFSLSGLDAKASGRVAEVTGLELSAKGDLAARPDKHSFSVAKFSLQAKGKADGEAFEARVSAPKLAITAEKAEGETLDAQVNLKGEQRALEAKLALAGVQGSSKALTVSEISIEFDARAGENAAKGRFGSPLQADLPARRYELSKIMASVSLTSPQLPQKSVALQMAGAAHADLVKDNAAANLTAKFDETTARVKVDLKKLSVRELGFELAVDRLDLDRYLPAQKEASAAAGGSASAGAEQPLDLSALKGITASGRAQFDSLVVQRLKLAEVRAEMRLAKGRLEISPHSAKLYEGALAGALSVDANGNRLAIKESLQGISVGPLVRDAAGRDAIEGRGNVAFELQGAGATVGAIKKSLEGNARMALRDGAIKGINLAERLRKVRAKLGSESAKRELADGKEQTDFSELTASFVIRNGVARNDDLAAKSPFLRLSGAGQIDIGNSKLDYVAKATVVASGKGQGGEELARLSGITVPVKLSGPFEAPGYEVDYGAVAAGLAKSKVADKLGERLGVSAPKAKTEGAAEATAPRDRVKEKLRGLLGR